MSARRARAARAPLAAALAACALAACALGAAGCRRLDMYDQPKHEPLEQSGFFADGRAARPLVQGTVARGRLEEDRHLFAGRVGGELAGSFPFPVTREVVERGRERYDIFCSPCHDRAGTGEGMIVRRGFKRPPSFHIERLREAPPGHFFDVITHGFGDMFDYSDRVPARDRWAIVAYVRALQRSQSASLEDVPAAERERLFSAAPPPEER